MSKTEEFARDRKHLAFEAEYQKQFNPQGGDIAWNALNEGGEYIHCELQYAYEGWWLKGRALDASHQRLKEALHRLEVSANTVKYCYSNRPENFAAALMSLQDDAESARAALEQAKDLS